MTPAFARRFGAMRADAAPSSLRIERRGATRSPSAGSVTATYTDGRGTMGITTLELVDSSPTGLGVRSASAIEPGMIVALLPGGKLVRCFSAIAVRVSKDGDTYEVGLRVTTRARAA